MNTAGGIVCSFLGGSVIYFTGVRGVYLAAALILAIMIPLLVPMLLAIKKESAANTADAKKELEA